MCGPHLELEFAADAIRALHLGQGNRAAIAKLSRPVSKLVAAIPRRVRLHPRQNARTSQHFGDRAGQRRRCRDTEQFSDGVRPGKNLRRANWCRCDPGVARIAHGARNVFLRWVRRQCVHEAVLELQIQ